ncbi:MAG: hypothetical protein H6742_14130 [Alphaproteobacteria bacterium]|nr:hypothetical protein [Alphaproteobacteria bacterium]
MTVSWLRLEQYALGELPPDQAAAVEAALAADPDARARLQAIREDARALAPLDLSLPDSGLPLPDEGTVEEELGEEELGEEELGEDGGEVVSLWPRVFGGVALLAAAAAVLVAVLPGEESAVEAGFKGGELVMSVEADHGGDVVAGDRIQVRVTCAPGERDAALRADGEVVWEGALACGNRVRLPGAWTVDGPTELCLRVGEEEVCEVVGE